MVAARHSPPARTFFESLDYLINQLNALKAAGYSDWYLPSADDLTKMFEGWNQGGNTPRSWVIELGLPPEMVPENAPLQVRNVYADGNTRRYIGDIVDACEAWTRVDRCKLHTVGMTPSIHRYAGFEYYSAVDGRILWELMFSTSKVFVMAARPCDAGCQAPYLP